jgi:gas vesicle protein GvpG
MFILDTLLINGISFVLDKVRTVAEQELDNPETLHQHLMEAQLDYEEGRIDEDTFAQIEDDILARLREVKATESTGGIADASSFEEIEVDFDHDEP